MVIFRNKLFSNIAMLNRIVSRLDKEKIQDYEVESKIPQDSISITTDLNDLRIYIPLDFEYSQYALDDFIRETVGYIRTNTVLDRNIYVMRLSSKITESQYYKLVKYIVEEEGFCVLLDR